jgi:hypothetical protein
MIPVVEQMPKLGDNTGARVCSALFATLQSNPITQLTIALGVVSLVAAILASVQAFLRFGERVEKHRATGSRFAVLRAEIEQVLSMHSDTGTLRAFMAGNFAYDGSLSMTKRQLYL